MNYYTFDELRKTALLNNIRDTKTSIGLWIKSQGYNKKYIRDGKVLLFRYYKE